MTKLEVATRLRDRTGMSQKQAMEAVDLFLGAIKSALKESDKVSLVGFGTFYVKTKEPRMGRNPRSGQKIKIPGKSVVAFKPGREFRQAVNDGAEAPDAAKEASARAAAPPAPRPPAQGGSFGPHAS